MVLSFIVCTWNRSDVLRRCLESLASQTCSNDDCEVVVVDNNSTDDTPAVVDEFASRCEMNVRCVKEARQGLSIARNAGIDAAEGGFLAFIDDDCTVEPGYVEALVRAFEETAAGMVAGKVTNVLPGGLVTDLPKGFDAARKVAHLDLGSERRSMQDYEYALGCNLSVRRHLALDVGGFRSDLGYAGDSKVVGEDTEFCDRVRATEATLVWEPRAAVLHCVGPERFTKAALRSAAYCYGQGSLTRRLGKRPAPVRRARAVTKSLAQAILSATAWPLVAWSPRMRFELELKMMEGLGKLGVALALRRRSAS